MGYGIQGRGGQSWLRQLDKPHDCLDFIKVLQGSKYRLILTKSGKIFVQGTKLKDLLGQHPAVVDSSEDSFIEIDPRIIFPLIKYGDKIIDIVAGKE